ncbi:MAG: peptidoglycan-binding domain-containing protein [Nostoc sp.]|uniref:peptidoglycan-binding domain-containing protein n=1 Tax=Nostoc sp. TaxID=1180 RepID=UPI002FF6A196
MSVLSYTNAQFRSILNGLGLRNQGSNEPNFPISSDEGNLDTDRSSVIEFQAYFGLATDGIVGPQTQAKAQLQMYVIQYELDLVIKPEPRIRPQNSPFYGLQTAEAIAQFRRSYGFEPDGNVKNDRIADLSVRLKLDELTPNARAMAEAMPV